MLKTERPSLIYRNFWKHHIFYKHLHAPLMNSSLIWCFDFKMVWAGCAQWLTIGADGCLMLCLGLGFGVLFSAVSRIVRFVRMYEQNIGIFSYLIGKWYWSNSSVWVISWGRGPSLDLLMVKRRGPASGTATVSLHFDTLRLPSRHVLHRGRHLPNLLPLHLFFVIQISDHDCQEN